MTRTRLLASLVALTASLGIVETASAGSTWSELHRPLELPAVNAGDPCPVSAVDPRVDWESINIFGASGTGPGPVYPGLGSPPVGEATMTPDSRRPAWFSTKVFWYVKPSYRGKALIRGQRLDGEGPMAFSERGTWSDEMRIGPRDTVQWGGRPPGSRGVPSGVAVRTTGCYGVQIDGARFSRTVVFSAVTSGS
jgi:hypothetical protein